MSKGRITRFLVDGAQDPAPSPIGQSAVPTLDERASLYLRAVHGKDDFGSEDYAKARAHILDAMAVEIATRRQVALASEPLKYRNPAHAPGIEIPVDVDPPGNLPGWAPSDRVIPARARPNFETVIFQRRQ